MKGCVPLLITSVSAVTVIGNNTARNYRLASVHADRHHRGAAASSRGRTFLNSVERVMWRRHQRRHQASLALSLLPVRTLADLPYRHLKFRRLVDGMPQRNTPYTLRSARCNWVNSPHPAETSFASPNRKAKLVRLFSVL